MFAGARFAMIRQVGRDVRGRRPPVRNVMSVSVLSVCLSKSGDARFLGHLDFARLVERSVRRSGLPVAYTRGFNPRLKLSFTDALPVGLGSTGEWVSLTLDEVVPIGDATAALGAVLPECVSLVETRRGAPPPPPEVVTYRVDVERGLDELIDALTAFLSFDEYLDETGRDVRATVRGGERAGDALLLHLRACEGRPPRPAPVLTALARLAIQAGALPPDVGAATKQAVVERLPGEDPWPDADVPAAPAPVASS